MNSVTIDRLTASELATVVELQRAELDRLLGEQRRLNDRIDKMLNMQEREQVLRQQTQVALDCLAEQRALGTKNTDSFSEQTRILDRLHRTERKLDALQTAIGQLIDFSERKEHTGDSAEAHSRGSVPGLPIA